MKRFSLIIAFLLLILIAFSVSCEKEQHIVIPADNQRDVVWAIDPVYDWADDFSSGLALVEHSHEQFFVDKSGQRRIENFGQLDNKELGFHNGVAIVTNGSEQHYLFRNGEVLDDPYLYSHNISSNFSNSLLLGEKNGLFGYLNLQNLWVVEPRFLDGDSFSNGFSVVRNEYHNEQYLVPNEGSWVPVSCRYYITDIAEGFAAANSEAYIDVFTGEIAIPGPFEDTGPFSENVAAVRQNGKYGYIDTTGKFAIAPQFQSAAPFSCGMARVLKGTDTYAFIDHLGNPVLEFDSSILPYDCFHEGILAAKYNNAYGLMNTDGEWVLKPQYDNILWDQNGYYLLLTKSGLIGLYNPITGATLDACYNKINLIDSKSGMMTIEAKGKLGLANSLTGEIVVPPYFEWDGNCGEGLISVKDPSSQKYGYIDYSGGWIIAPQFDWAGKFCEGLAHVQKGNKHGYITHPIYHSTLDKNIARLSGIATFKKKGDDDFLTCKEFVTILTTVCGTTDTDFPNLSLNMEQLLTRETAAILLEEYASCVGESTSFFLSAYDDISNLGESSISSISYVTSIGLMDVYGHQFNPKAPINYCEAIKLAVRLNEYLLDAQDKKCLNHAMDIFLLI